MDDLFWVFIIIFFVVAPILEKVLKGGRTQQQKPPQRPQGRMQAPQRQRLPDGRTTTVRQPSSAPTRSEDATDLLPSDLWEILTGERRAPDRPEPEPPPIEPARPSRADVPSARPARERTVRETRPRDEESAVAEVLARRERELVERRLRTRPRPPPASLETEPEPEPRRHATFHEKLEHLPAAPRVRRAAGPVLELDPRDRAALRRAILMQEIFGRPRGLED